MDSLYDETDGNIYMMNFLLLSIEQEFVSLMRTISMK